MSYFEIDKGGFRTDEGLAIFSRYPIIESSFLLLSRNFADNDDVHQRILQRALIDTPFGKITLFNTHFALGDVAQKRAVLEIWDWIQQFPLPQILVGDLNSEPHSSTIRFLVGKEEINGKKGDFIDLWEHRFGEVENTIVVEEGESTDEEREVELSEEEKEKLGYTFFAWEKKKRIDFLLFRGDLNDIKYDPKIIGCEGVKHSSGVYNNADLNLYASDHCGVVVNLENIQ